MPCALPCELRPSRPAMRCAQDSMVMAQISSYFNKPIEELAWDDEDKFVSVLQATLGP